MKVRNIALPLILTVAAGAGVVKSCGNKTVQPERIEAAANNTNPLSDSAKTLAIFFPFFPFFPFFTKKGTKELEEIQGTEKSEVTIQSTQIVDLNEEELRKLYEKVINEAGQYKNININQVLHCIRIKPDEHKPPILTANLTKKSKNPLVESTRRIALEMHYMNVLAYSLTKYSGHAVEENKAGNRPYALQAVAAILANPKLMENRNVQIFFPSFYGSFESYGISEFGDGKRNCQCFVDFICDLTSEKNAPIFENKDVQQGLGVMLMALADDPYRDRGKEEEYYKNLSRFLEFLRNNPEYISHPSLRSYITYAGRDYKECVKQMKDGFVFNVPFKEPQ